jgi:L-aspartate oxidase
VSGLYATGEVACSGVHGANRLASNSLLEGLVFSRRIAQVLPDELRPVAEPAPDRRQPGVVSADVRAAMQATMTDRVGVIRNGDGLVLAAKHLEELAATHGEEGTAAWETTNLVTISAALTLAATLREETRGSHWREDFPDRDDEHFAGHVDVVLVDGTPQARFHPSPATDGGGS